MKMLVSGPTTGTATSSYVGGEYPTECYYSISSTFWITRHSLRLFNLLFVYFGWRAFEWFYSSFVVWIVILRFRFIWPRLNSGLPTIGRTKNLCNVIKYLILFQNEEKSVEAVSEQRKVFLEYITHFHSWMKTNSYTPIQRQLSNGMLV